MIPAVALLVIVWHAAGLLAARGSAMADDRQQSQVIDVTYAVVKIGAAKEDLGVNLAAAQGQLIRDVRRRSGMAGWGDEGGVAGQQEASTQGVVINLKLADTVGREDRATRSPNSFAIAVDARAAAVTVAATDLPGLHAGIGRLQRELRVFIGGCIDLPRNFSCVLDGSASLWPMRGHQFTAAHYSSMFRTWPEFTQYAKDQQLFGTNQIELAHFGGHMPNDKNPGRSAGIIVEDLVQYSASLEALNLNVSFWWSLDIWTTRKNETTEAWQRMPRIDSMFFPGGDGGSLVWPEIEDAATELHKYHPGATIWVSAQEMNSSALDSFFATIDSPVVRKFLSGVVIGPHWSIPTPEILKRVPTGYPLRLYPDICHSRR